MKLHSTNQNSDSGRIRRYADFFIEPSNGKEIISVFRDFTSGLLIVEEIEINCIDPNPIQLTTIDADRAKIIYLEERKTYIDYSDISEIAEKSGLQRICRREIDPETGNEFLIEKLFDINSGESIASSKSVAFRETERDSIFVSHQKSNQQKATDELFWKNEYSQKSFTERVNYWAAAMFRQMRWQNEMGLDIYTAYSENWYQFVINREPDFDKILSVIFEKYKRDFDCLDCSPTEVLRIIGKGNE